MLSNKLLFMEVIIFLEVVCDCYKNTPFEEDKNIYKEDIILISKWVSKLSNDENIQILIKEMNEDSTKKHFFDYWRRGQYGEKENNAFKRMLKNINQLKSDENDIEL